MEFQTTIERLEKAVSELQGCGYTKDQAISRIIFDFEEKGDQFLAEYARANLV